MSAALQANDEPLVVRGGEGAVAVLTLDRPASRNSLSCAMLAALSTELAAIATDDGVRAVVLAANGPAFSAGHDLKELTARRGDADGGEAFFRECMAACAAVMQAIAGLPQPVVAAVEGIATAAGCQLVATCDLAAAAENARFATPGVDIGLFCSTPAVALSRAVARKPAMEMLLLGEMVPAEEARRIGLVNRVVPAGQAFGAAMDIAQRIASRSAVAVRMGKRAFNRQLGLPLPDAYEAAGAAMVENLLAEDAAEGIGAFIGKRKPVWRHR
jgi:enoyl-CoA hydratase/carnithine racemase